MPSFRSPWLLAAQQSTGILQTQDDPSGLLPVSATVILSLLLKELRELIL